MEKDLAVHHQLDDLTKEVEVVHNQIGNLTERLKSVLGSEPPPSEAVSTTQPVYGNSATAIRLAELTESVRMMQTRLEV